MNSHGTEFHVRQKFSNMDEESQDSGFDSDVRIGQFFDAVTGENTAEVYEKEVMPEGVVPEYENSAVNVNPNANATVDADENVDAADNLPSVDDPPVGDPPVRGSRWN